MLAGPGYKPGRTDADGTPVRHAPSRLGGDRVVHRIVVSACLALLAPCATSGELVTTTGTVPAKAAETAQDGIAQAVVELFAKACVLSLGHRDQAKAVGFTTDAPERLPGEKPAPLRQGCSGGVGW